MIGEVTAGKPLMLVYIDRLKKGTFRENALIR